MSTKKQYAVIRTSNKMVKTTEYDRPQLENPTLVVATYDATGWISTGFYFTTKKDAIKQAKYLSNKSYGLTNEYKVVQIIDLVVFPTRSK